jgi:CBS domain-containing protein
MHETKTIMSRNVITVGPGTPLHQVVTVLAEHDITGVPVVDEDGTLLGIITEKNVLGLLAEPHTAGGVARDYMTRDVVAFDENEDLIAVCESLVNSHFRRVPILAAGKLVGIISRRDIIKYILEPIG